MPDAVHGVSDAHRSRQVVNALRIPEGSPQTVDLAYILANELRRLLRKPGGRPVG